MKPLIMRAPATFMLAALLLLSASIAAAADRQRIVGQVFVGSEATSRQNLALFRQTFRELGYVEGKNFTFLARYADGRFEDAPALYESLRADGAEVVFAGTYRMMVAATGLKQRTPAVLLSCGAEVFAERATPDRHFTGITCLSAELASKQLQLIRELVPRSRRIAVLYNPDYPSAVAELQHLRSAAENGGVSLQPATARTAGEIEPKMTEIAASGTKAVVVITDGIFYAERQRLAAIGLRHGLAMISSFRDYAAAGMVMAYGSSLKEMITRGAALADKILRGTNPADLPFEQPTKFELTINLKTARALGVKVPPSLVARAEQVIE